MALVPGEYTFKCLECHGEGSIEVGDHEYGDHEWVRCGECRGEGIQDLDEEEALERIDAGFQPLSRPSFDALSGQRLECPRCFQIFDLDEAKASFNHQYSGSADWQYDDVISEPVCASCASTEADKRWMQGGLEAADGPPPSGDQLASIVTSILKRFR
jgi:hypothetical protein